LFENSHSISLFSPGKSKDKSPFEEMNVALPD